MLEIGFQSRWFLFDGRDGGGDLFLFYCFPKNKMSSSYVVPKGAGNFASISTFEEQICVFRS